MYYTKEQLQSEVLAYIVNNDMDLIDEIFSEMHKAAKEGHECLYRYPMSDQKIARRMEHYFKNAGFHAESSYLNINKDTKEPENWYVSIFWFLK